MSELKNCPFCGGEAEIIGGPEDWSPTFYDPDSGGDPIAVVCQTCECGLHSFEDYTDAIAAWKRRTDRWIPVSERLPEKGKCLVAHIDGTVHPASVIFGEDFKHCTHWMPLPEPPEGEEK